MSSSRDDLLEQLRRGRGNALRELLAMPRDVAGDVLLDCLCTYDVRGDLVTQCEGYVELLLALGPPLARWFEHVDAMPSDVGEEAPAFAMRMLRLAGERGSQACAAFLIEQVERGVHWRRVLEEFAEGTPLPEAVWQLVLPRMTATDLRWFVRDDEDWRERATRWPTVAAAVADARARMACLRWSIENYRAAESPALRCKVLRTPGSNPPPTNSTKNGHGCPSMNVAGSFSHSQTASRGCATSKLRS